MSSSAITPSTNLANFATASQAGIVSTTAQIFGGAKTFQDAPVIGNASGIVAASATVPGVVTTGAQTFAGAKTFSATVASQANTGFQTNTAIVRYAGGQAMAAGASYTTNLESSAGASSTGGGLLIIHGFDSGSGTGFSALYGLARTVLNGASVTAANHICTQGALTTNQFTISASGGFVRITNNSSLSLQVYLAFFGG